MEELRKIIRDIPDYPKKGIIFKDITPLLANPKSFKKAIDLLANKVKDIKIDAIASMEARGFIFGSALAYKLGKKFIPMRKKGKLPYKTIKEEYELEYGKDIIEMHVDAVKPGERVLIVDDLLATGGTAVAVANLVKQAKGIVAGMAFLIDLTFLKGREKLKDYKVFSIIKY